MYYASCRLKYKLIHEYKIKTLSPGTGHRAQGTRHRAPGTGHLAPSKLVATMRPPHLAIAFGLSVAAQALWVCAPTPPNDQNFRYEKLQNYGLGKRVIPNYRRVNVGYAYPEPLRGAWPAGATGAGYVRAPYRSLYQGVRRRGDRRVYMKRFDYAAKPSGHRIFCQAITDCEVRLRRSSLCSFRPMSSAEGYDFRIKKGLISHVAIETGGGGGGGVPVLLRGGAGYRHLSVVVKAPAGAPLRGSLKAYCRGPPPPRAVEVDAGSALGARWKARLLRTIKEAGRSRGTAPVLTSSANLQDALTKKTRGRELATVAGAPLSARSAPELPRTAISLVPAESVPQSPAGTRRVSPRPGGYS
ncbi:hypothetical protein RR46_11272 [Papilio xuthus]|uniref:Uncharacterized protein n=1 Tax=Papilio xuthus TaxID=66420 RepID=A0A194PXT2_PAPXU|nr:hypothetical protein RR46_11272 [Papilio xuthus]